MCGWFNKKMNALECRTLTATCMYDSCAVYSMAHCVCLFNIRSIELYPAPEHGYGTVQVSSESVHDLGVGGRHLAISLYKTSVMYIPS